MLVRNAVNYGWPFCATPDQPYIDYDFTPDSQQSGEAFNCLAPVNDSRNNTGLRESAPGRLAGGLVLLQHGPGPVPGAVPELDGNGISPMGGPAMQKDANISSPFRWPNAFAGQPIFYEWSRDYAKVMQLNRPNGNQLADIKHLFGGAPSQNPNIVLDNPMDMEFGPDNALYELEYGTGYFAELPAAQLARIDYVRNGQYTPVVKAAATPSSGTTAPLTVKFSSAGTNDANGDRLRYQWDFQSDGTFDSTEANPTFTYTAKGIYEATLKVTDSTGRSASWQARVIVGNQAPRVQLTVVSTTPPFNFGDTVNYTVTITDDQPVDCARVSVAYILGHETHGHPQTSTAGCTRHDLGPDRHGARRREQPERRVRGPVHGQPGRRRDAAAGQRRGPARAGPGAPDRPGLVRSLVRASPPAAPSLDHERAQRDVPFLVDDEVRMALVVDRHALDAADLAEVVEGLGAHRATAGAEREAHVLGRGVPALGVVLEHRGGFVGGVEIADHRVEHGPVTGVQRAEARGRRAAADVPEPPHAAGLRNRVRVLEQRLGMQDLDEQRVAVDRDG